MSEKPDLDDALELVMVATGFDSEEDEFEEYNRKQLMMHSDPSSPFERMNAGRNRSRDKENAVPPPRRVAVVSGEKILLPEREPRYPNINALLKVPAFIARKAKMLSESPTKGTRGEGVTPANNPFGAPSNEASKRLFD